MSHEINAVNVYSIDEERLRFRVIVAIDADNAGGLGRGSYDINIPIPTSFTNSHEYSSCRILCDTFMAYPDAGVAAPIWVSAAGVATKLGALELQITAPSTQTTGSYVDTAAQRLDHGNIEVSGFKQIIPGQVVNLGGPASWTQAATTLGWRGNIGGSVHPIICANPFGQQITIRFVEPTTRDLICVQDFGAAGVDTCKYVIQFQIEMVPNK